MSMIGFVLGITPAQIAALRAKPALVNKVTRVVQEALHRKDLDAILQRMTPDQRQQYSASTAALEASPLMQEVRALNEEARKQTADMGPLEEALSLEKSWHVLHYLFTGHSGPAQAPGDLLLTGEELGEDTGYGPARLHQPAATREFSDFLQALDVARLQGRIDVGEMNRLNLYGAPRAGSSPADPESGLGEVVGFYYPRLRDYVNAMAGKGNGLLTWLS